MFLKKRKKDTHKGDYGHVFILAGSTGLTGAAALCGQACMRSGAGLVTLGIPRSLNVVMEIKLTEVMTCPLPETRQGTFSLKAKAEALKKINNSDIAVLGPGLSSNKETQQLIRELAVSVKRPMVLDADALNAISENADVLRKVKSPYVITPHPGEMARLLKKDTDYIKKNRLIVAKKFANYYNAVVVLKGSGTIVAEPGANQRVYVNKTGNPGMATAGSGDVLTGVIAGFMAQGLKPFDAARFAVYTHGLAGDLAKKEKGEEGLIAGDILEKIPEAIKKLTVHS
ncbi:MAG: NAD(P)H-hydrate dehydratase [Candidatus Omnitrophica bacterium]|nr:NAD(P)H-hydrate dehydratase [Candidatus Omnitrophota bacterium]MBU1932438.1 NAD(P)H-hydrate dehydratase [Candidatus Omnitrophota bacterium]